MMFLTTDIPTNAPINSGTQIDVLNYKYPTDDLNLLIIWMMSIDGSQQTQTVTIDVLIVNTQRHPILYHLITNKGPNKQHHDLGTNFDILIETPN
jgi:hypothetical protein